MIYAILVHALRFLFFVLGSSYIFHLWEVSICAFKYDGKRLWEDDCISCIVLSGTSVVRDYKMLKQFLKFLVVIYSGNQNQDYVLHCSRWIQRTWRSRHLPSTDQLLSLMWMLLLPSNVCKPCVLSESSGS